MPTDPLHLCMIASSFFSNIYENILLHQDKISLATIANEIFKLTTIRLIAMLVFVK